MIYLVIYPRGDQKKIDIAQAFSYEKDEYNLASRKEFYDEKDAVEYAITLADKNSLKYVGVHYDEYNNRTKHNYLD